MDQITQPHYPRKYQYPDYEMELSSPFSTRHLERNVSLGPAHEATVLYGPDKLDYQKCKDVFEKAKSGALFLVLHAGNAGETMDEHIYYEEKFKIMQTKANIVKFPDHVVHSLINTERKADSVIF